MGLENLGITKTRIQFEECPEDTYRLRGMAYCSFYNSNECKKREECSYYRKMQSIKEQKIIN